MVPTGNFGNAYSAWTAARLGAPIERVVAATNANRYLADLLGSGFDRAAEVIPTVAPAMDIQIPSNLERLPLEARSWFGAGWASDDEIRATIARVWEEHAYLLDPHTAVAWKVASERESAHERVIVATAHPAKFADVVAEAIGSSPELPPGLARLGALAEHHRTIDATPEALLSILP